MNPSPFSFSLRQLQYAVAIADELSFRRAAKHCHVSQPSLSAQVAELEEALGVRLFERDRRRVMVTAAGRVLVLRARRLLLEVGDLVEAAKRLSDPLTGTLRLGVIPTVSPYLLPLLTPRLKAKFEHLRIVWQEDKTDVLLDQLNGGTLDAALVAMDTVIDEFEHDVIAIDPFVLAGPFGHPLAMKPSAATASELKGAEVLLLDDGHCFREQALAFCSKARAREMEFRATSLTTLVQMVAGGAGVTLLPALSLSTEAQRARIKTRPLASPTPSRTLALIWRKSSPLGPALRHLTAVAREVYPKPREASRE